MSVHYNECVICYERVGRNRNRPCLRHAYHKHCLDRWRNTKGNWNGQCLHCNTIIDERARSIYSSSLDKDAEPDAELKGTGVRRCPRCRVHFIRYGGCDWVTCQCGHGFRTTAPDLQPWYRNDYYITLAILACLAAIVILISLLTHHARNHPDCQREHLKFQSTCHPCWHEYNTLKAVVDGLDCDTDETPNTRLLVKHSAVMVERQQFRCSVCDHSNQIKIDEAVDACARNAIKTLLLG